MQPGQRDAFEVAREVLLARYGTVEPGRVRSLGGDDVEVGAAENLARRETRRRYPMQPDRQYPQPFEGITGTVRDDFLLSLDEQAAAHRDVLIAMVRHLRRAALVGHPAPVIQRMQGRTFAPRAGDLVVENSVMFRHDTDARVKGLGILLERRWEWETSDEQWEQVRAEEELFDDPRPTDEAWYIQYGPDADDICRWTNCDFQALPLDPREFDCPLGSSPLGTI